MPLPGDKQIASMSSLTPTAALSGCVFKVLLKRNFRPLFYLPICKNVLS